jgi:hypothetical protein
MTGFDQASKAPDHLVSLIGAIAPRPHHLNGRPTDEQWRDQLQRVADRIWAEAFHAGAALGLSLQTPQPMLLVTEEERARLVRDLS